MQNATKTVLVAEDEKPLVNALRYKLEHEGFQVYVASTGKECVELCSAQHFDVVLLDLIMPEMDGFQALEQLRNLPSPPTVVFVLSNLSQHEDEERVLALGAKKFFVKSDMSLARVVEEVKNV